MSADLEKVRDTLADQLANFDDRLEAKVDDVEMLADIQDGIGKLLTASSSSEADIRRVLQERYEAGHLRKETFQLVKSMLDRFVSEQVPTAPPSLAADSAPSPAAEEASASAEDEDNVTLTGTQILEETPDFNEDPADLAEVFDRHTGDAPADDKHASTDVLGEGAVKPGSATDRVQVGSLLRDRFLLQEQVAGGSMGVVYKAMDRRLAEAGSGDAHVAIKVLSPQLSRNGTALRALQQEAAKGRCLVHANIVRFIDLDRDDDLFFIVMEWLDGQNLAEMLDDPRTKRFEPQRGLEIARRIGDALVYAHRCGIVHADVKPGNIMIMPNGEAKLFDFGVARVRQSQLLSDSTFDAHELGAVTPAYSSMQVLTGEEPVPADDVFSLACLLYRLLAGYRVFGPRNAAEAAEEGMKPQRLELLSDGQWRAMKKALSYSRVTRYDNMQEFLDALDTPVKDDTISLEVERSYEVEDSGGGFGKGLLILVMLLGAAGVVANKFGYLDPFKAYLSSPTPQQSAPVIDKIVVEPEPIAGQALEETTDESKAIPPGEAATTEESVTEPDPAPTGSMPSIDEEQPIASEEPTQGATPDALIEALVEELPDSAAAEPVAAASELFDFSTLPPATLQVPINAGRNSDEVHTVSLHEDGEPATIEFVRSNPTEPMTLRIEEVGYSGNRSPWASGQYYLSDDGFVDFPAGQAYGRIKMSMESDPLREADQQSIIRVRNLDEPASELANITVFLRDDDQREFESQLPPNTIAFAVSQATVSEADPAAKLDVIRFNADSSSIVISYTIEDVTATIDEDFFTPGVQDIEFGPGQRSARVLIPLVQDSTAEGNEAFAVQLQTTNPVEGIDVYQRIVVMIRDDE